MAEYDNFEAQLSNAVIRGDLEETKRISTYLFNYGRWHPRNDLLCSALVYKHLDIARLFLSQGCDVVGDRRKHSDYTALHLAVLYGDSSIVKAILEGGAYPDSRNLEGMTPLHLVVYRNLDEIERFQTRKSIDEESSIIIDTLLQYSTIFGSNINIPVASDVKSCYTVLHLAAECGNENIIPILLNRNANINANARGGLTPLHIAATHGHIKIVKMLLDYNAIAFSKDAKRKSPLRWAMEGKHIEIVKMLISYKQRYYPNLPKLSDDRYILLSAINLNDAQIVKLLLNEGVSIKSSWGNGESALHVAVKQKNEEIVNLLLDHGANLGAMSKDGKTPLYLAVEIGAVKIVDIILSRIPSTQSKIFLTGPSKCTPLHVAVMSDNEEMVRLLLLKGSHVYKKKLVRSSNEFSSESLFHVAAKNGSLPICKLLLEYGVNIDSTDVKGRNALYFAAERGNLEVVNALCDIFIEQKSKDKFWSQGYAALYVAAYYGNDQVVNLLLQKGVDVKANIEGYSTPLHAAIERNNEKIVESLLENGFDVNERRSDNHDGRTALHCAVEKGFYPIVDRLLQKNADVDAKITHDIKAGYTALHCAVEEGDFEIVKLLLQKNANVNAKNEANHTPLFLAVLHNWEAIVQYLVDHGADVNIFGKRDKKIKTLFPSHCIDDDNDSYIDIRPLSLAVFHGHENVIKILLRNGASVDVENEIIFPLHLAAVFSNGEILGKLLQYGGDINSKCTRGLTPLSHAVKGGRIETIKHLIKKGALLDTKTEKGYGLLHIAIESPSMNNKIIKILLECDLDVNARDKHEKTPLHCCLPNNGMNGDKNLFEVLLDYGAEVNALDEVGNTPLHVAVSNSDWKSVKTLLEYGADINVVNQKGTTALEDIFSIIDRPGQNIFHEIDSNIAKLITKVIVLREDVGLYVHEKNLQLLQREEIEYYYQNCKEELNKTKCTEICKNVRFSDILIKNTNMLDIYFRNPAVIKILEFTEFRNLFPIYAPIFGARIRKAKERKFLLESSSKNLKTILKFQFPSLIVQHIFSFLSLVDLKNLSRAFQRPPRFSPKLRKQSE